MALAKAADSPLAGKYALTPESRHAAFGIHSGSVKSRTNSLLPGRRMSASKMSWRRSASVTPLRGSGRTPDGRQLPPESGRLAGPGDGRKEDKFPSLALSDLGELFGIQYARTLEEGQGDAFYGVPMIEEEIPYLVPLGIEQRIGVFEIASEIPRLP